MNTANSGYATIRTDANGRCSGIAPWTSYRNPGGLATVGTFGGTTIDIKVIARCSLRAAGAVRSAQTAQAAVTRQAKETIELATAGCGVAIAVIELSAATSDAGIATAPALFA